MNPLFQLGLTLPACTFVPLASAQKNAPANPPDSPGSPGEPADPARPGIDRDHKIDCKPASEEDFVRTAAKKGISEVKVAQLGVEKAEDAKVRELARMLVKDHTAANASLKTIADDMAFKPDEKADAKADEKFGQEYKELSALNGNAFDKAFLKHMSMCHEEGVAWYEAGRKVAKSEQVTVYIEKTLPVLKAHAAKIRELHTGTRPDAGSAQPGDSKADAKRE